MGKLAGWRPRGHHERVRESYMINFVYCKRGNRHLPYRPSVDRKKEQCTLTPVVACRNFCTQELLSSQLFGFCAVFKGGVHIHETASAGSVNVCTVRD